MPDYEYMCQACGHEWEIDQKINEDPVKTCPKCKQSTAKRLVSLPTFILKGGGWSEDGYSK